MNLLFYLDFSILEYVENLNIIFQNKPKMENFVFFVIICNLREKVMSI